MLWGIISVMQLITTMTLFNVQFPANAAMFINLILQIANLNLIPTDTINSHIFNFTPGNIPNANF